MSTQQPLSTQQYLELMRQRRDERYGQTTTTSPVAQVASPAPLTPSAPAPAPAPITEPAPTFTPAAPVYTPPAADSAPTYANQQQQWQQQPISQPANLPQAQPVTQQQEQFSNQSPTAPTDQNAPSDPGAATNQDTSADSTAAFDGVPQIEPESDVFEWLAPSRPFKKRDRQFYVTVTAIVFLVSLITFFAGQFLLIAVVVSIGFLAYVISSVPPEQITNKLTTYGIRTDSTLYYWEEMTRFWFETKFKQPVLQIEVTRFPGRITLLLGNITPEGMRAILKLILVEEKPIPTLFDKAGQWLQDKIPLEVRDETPAA